MSPDFVFIGAGVLAAAAALANAVRGVLRRQRHALSATLLWASLATGCFLQGFAPNLKVERNAFVMPAISGKAEPPNPRLIVERERRMKMLSLAFLAIAGVGLFFHYRRTLLPPPATLETTA